MSLEAVEQYQKCLKSGQKYLKAAQTAGTNPYPAVLDEIIDSSAAAGSQELGLVNIPSELIVGTKSAGRTAALAGNFMPILDPDTEFAAKWIRLCDAHISDEGIRDPILCFEHLGKFYVQEGNKRVSVLKSYDAPTIPGIVTRILPPKSDDPEIKLYYEFLSFYKCSGLYGITFSQPGGYEKLLASLGLHEDHVWTEEEKRSFSSGFHRFSEAYAAMKVRPVPAADALLVFLQVFPFSDLKEVPTAQLSERIASLWTDIKAQKEDPNSVEVKADLQSKDKSLVAKILSVGRPDKVRVAFIYGFDPKTSTWTRAHDHGREYLEEQLGEKVIVNTYRAIDRDYFSSMEQAVQDEAKLIFATTPPMIDACRKIATLHKNVRVFNCGLFQPYTGVRMYHGRIYECKFITGAIAGAMAENDEVGYVGGYPIFGEPASINAFALGARMTNPRARVKLLWSSTRKDSVREFLDKGICVISNRDASRPSGDHWDLEWGTYKLDREGEMLPLAVPCWNWGALYVKIVRSFLDGSFDEVPVQKAVNYWLGMDSGVIDIQLSPTLPEGVRSLALMLKEGLAGGWIDPFRSRILDQEGNCRNDGEKGFAPDELMQMDWLCDNVDGTIPAFEDLLPGSRELVRLLGLYREKLSPLTEEKQL